MRAVFSPALECYGGLGTFELVTGYSFAGASPADALRTMADVMNLDDCVAACAHLAECAALNFETGLCVLLNSSASYPSVSRTASRALPGGLKVSQFPVFTIYAE